MNSGSGRMLAKASALRSLKARHRPDGSFFCYPLCANHRAPRCGPERIMHTRQMHSVIVHSTMTPPSCRRRKCIEKVHPSAEGLGRGDPGARARMTSKKAWLVLKHRTCALCELFFPSCVCSQSRGKYHTHGNLRATEADTVEFHFYAVSQYGQLSWLFPALLVISFFPLCSRSRLEPTAFGLSP